MSFDFMLDPVDSYSDDEVAEMLADLDAARDEQADNDRESAATE
jgi:hypothetical protein